MKFSQKTIDFIRTPARTDILEGTARSSKTLSAMLKFGLYVNGSSRRQHLMSASDVTVAFRNLVTPDKGFLELFPNARVGTDRRYGAHLVFWDSKGHQKIIYLLGFKDKSRWDRVLGSTMGCALIDEANLADPAFIAQARRSQASVEDSYLVETLNPSNPNLPIYQDINRARPVHKYASSIPAPILEDLRNSTGVLQGAHYWHFTFADNPTMTQDKIDYYKTIYPVGSFFYRSLIQGLRGVAEGSVFGEDLIKAPTYEVRELSGMSHVWQDKFTSFSVGIDLGNDAKRSGSVLVLLGVTNNYEQAVIIDSHACKATEANKLVAEIVETLIAWYRFIDTPRKFLGAYIDSYGAIEVLLATIRNAIEAQGYRHMIRVEPCIKFGEQGGRANRLRTILLLLSQQRLCFGAGGGAEMIREQLSRLVYSTQDNLPLDNNQFENDCYDAFAYALAPYTFRFATDLKV